MLSLVPKQKDVLPTVARGLGGLTAEDLGTGNLTLELGLSLWMKQAGLDPSGLCNGLLELREALLDASGIDRRYEPVPLLAGDDRRCAISLAIYLTGLIDRAARATGLPRSGVIEGALASL